MDGRMKKRSVGFMKIMGAVMVASLLFTTNVHAKENNSEDFDAVSEEIDAQGTDELENEMDQFLSDLLDIKKGMSRLTTMLEQVRKYIIKGLNKNVYVKNNISGDASFEDIISKINDIKYQGTLNVTLDSDGKYTLESGYYDGGTIDVSALIEAARQEGYESGFADGSKAAE